MKRFLKRYVLAVVLAVLMLPAFACAKDAPKLKQFYICKGTDPAGSQYQVNMETRVVEGTQMYKQWLDNGHVIVFGMGFYVGDIFVGTEWFGGNPAQSATMFYRIKGKTLQGQWMPVYDGKLYPETCIEADGNTIPKPVEQQEHPDVDSGQTQSV